MPFNTETAAAAGQKGGPNRWKDKDPATVRNKRLCIAVTQAELKAIDEKAEANAIPRVELVVRAVKAYEP